MSNQIKAKVRVNDVQESRGKNYQKEGQPEEKLSETVYMHPVYGDGTENKSFSEATPSGLISLTITNPNAYGFFVANKEYYVDFTPAE